MRYVVRCMTYGCLYPHVVNYMKHETQEERRMKERGWTKLDDQ